MLFGQISTRLIKRIETSHIEANDYYNMFELNNKNNE